MKPREKLQPWLGRGWLLGLLLVAVTVLAYFPASRAGFIWDDDFYVTENPLLNTSEGLRRIWFSTDSPSQYFPLTYTTFYFERFLWGLHPAGYHWVNILLHATNVLLIWRLLARLRLPGAWLAAAVFALHPVQVESVAWITELKNVLMAFFFLLALLAWTSFIDEKAKRPWRFYALALACYALALLSKTTACTLPVALWLILWLKKISIDWRRLAQIAPFVMLGLGMGLVTIWWERHHQGTMGQPFEIGMGERVLIASRAVWFYFSKLLWPAHLMFSYPRWKISVSDPAAYVWLAATAVIGAVIWRARRWTGRGVEVAAIFFVATLGPVLGFIMLYTFLFSFVADHYQYLACLGPIALGAAGIEIGLHRFAAGKLPLGPALTAALLLTFGTLTWFQCVMYHDNQKLWQTTVRQNPDSWMAHNNLGHVYLQNGQWDDAITQFRFGLQLKPDDERACYNLGLALAAKGQIQEASAQYQRAVEINPRFAEACNNLGNCFLQQGMAEKAITPYQKALALRSDNAEAHNNLGDCFFELGRLDEALAHFQKAAELKPDYAEAHHNLGNVLLQKGRIAEAISHYDKTLQLKPDDTEAGNNLAWTLATCPSAPLRDGPKAVLAAEKVNRLVGGGNPDVLCTLAAAYAEAGRFSQAVTTAQSALRLAEAQSNTALAGQLHLEMKSYQAGIPFHCVESTSGGSANTPR